MAYTGFRELSAQAGFVSGNGELKYVVGGCCDTILRKE